MAPKNSNTIVLSSDDAQVKLISKVGPAEQVQTKSFVDFYKSLSDIAHFDTGLLPLDGTGLLSLRSALNHMQFVFQYAPGVYPVAWTGHEGGTPRNYHLAQPWRIVVMDLVDGNLLGGKQFFSPRSIISLDQPLYHTCFPNVNCRGYGPNNAVGWVCIYRNKDISEYDLKTKLDYCLKRISGEETYNDANMSGTDGTRFYGEFSKHKFLHSPVEWEKKTSEEGFGWTTQENIWLPILVKSPDEQQKHDPKGQPLTLRWAMYGHYSAYYNDTAEALPKSGYGYNDDDKGVPRSKWANRKYFNLLSRSDGEVEPVESQLFVNFKKAFVAKVKEPEVELNPKDSGSVDFGSATVIKQLFTQKCDGCSIVYATDDKEDLDYEQKKYWVEGDWSHVKTVKFLNKDGKHICSKCLDKIFTCKLCNEVYFTAKHSWVKADFSFDDSEAMCGACHIPVKTSKFHCPKCQEVYTHNHMPSTSTQLKVAAWLGLFGDEAPAKWSESEIKSDDGVIGCVKCMDVFACEFCKKMVAGGSEVDATALELVDAPAEKFKLCSSCYVSHVICACKKLVSTHFVAELGDGTNCCQSCLGTKPTGELFWDPEHTSEGVVLDMGNFKAPPTPDIVIVEPIQIVGFDNDTIYDDDGYDDYDDDYDDEIEGGQTVPVLSINDMSPTTTSSDTVLEMP